MKLLSLSTLKDHSAYLSKPCMLALEGNAYCANCKTRWPHAEGRSFDIDLDPEDFSKRWHVKPLNVGPMIVVRRAHFEVLRRDVAEALRLPTDFYLGSVSIGGVPCDTYVSCVGGPETRITIRSDKVGSGSGCCKVCKRPGSGYLYSDNSWVLASDLGERQIVSGDVGRTIYVTEARFAEIPARLKKELRVTEIGIRDA